jgi:dTMP kinase
MFIAVDGIDGAGKTTLVRQLVEHLKMFNPVATKEPTGESHWGQKLREAARNGRLPRDEEIEYFHQDRLHHIATMIRPAVEAGKTVISDRYVDSTLAFQTDSPEQADELYETFLPEILVPDITFILDCPVETGLRRIRRDRPSVTEYEKREVLERAREIYKSRSGEHYVHLDASRDPASTLQQALDQLVRRFRKVQAAWTPPSLEQTIDG